MGDLNAKTKKLSGEFNSKDKELSKNKIYQEF